MRPPRSVVAVVGLLVAGMVGAALWLEFDSPVLGRAALARMGPVLGGRLDARAFRFRLIRGLILEGLTATSDMAGGRFTLDAEALVRRQFDFTPAGIIKYLNLRRPIFKKTAAYGHFGRPDPDFTWERTDRVKDLRDDARV